MASSNPADPVEAPVETTTATLAEENTEASPPSVIAAQNENIEVDASFLFHNIFKV
jgi:hypothetical protein